MSTEPSIYDLFRQVRNHPDFIGGVIWTKDDLPEGFDPRRIDGRYIEDVMCERGQEAIDHEVESA